MTINRGNVQKFQETVGSGSGLYLKGKDYEDARKIRPIAWLKNGNLVDIVMYLEGWINAKDDKGKSLPNGKPVRFDPEEEIPSLDWKKSSYMGGPERAQTPKSNLAILHWDYFSKSIKVSTFHQVSVVKHISNMLSPTTEDGKENEMYVEDLTQIDIVLKKGDKDKDPWTITTKALKSPDYDADCKKALQDFVWSWDAFLACEQIEDHPTVISYVDVLEVMSADKPASTAAKASPAAKQPAGKVISEPEDETSSDYAYDKEWQKMKTQKGAIVGDQSLETLQGWKATIEKQRAAGNKTSQPLYDAICSGIKDLSDSSGQDDDPTAF